MQRKKLATKIASILLSAAMLVSTTVTAFATDGEVSVAAEQTEVQMVAETADDEALEASEEDAAASEELTEGETAAEEEITADEEITEEITSEEAQENVEEAQVLDADEAQVLDAEQVVAEENEISVASDTKNEDRYDAETLKKNGYTQVATDSTGSNIYYKYENGTLDFQCVKGKTDALPYAGGAGYTAWSDESDTTKTASVQEVVIGEGITEIGAANFENFYGYYPNLKSVKLSSTVKKIGQNAFVSTPLTTINLENVTSIGETAFQKTQIQTVQLKQAAVTIDVGAFEMCNSLTSFEATGNVTLGSRSFMRCEALETFKCGGAESIPVSAFSGCTKLNTCTANGVKSIGCQAFSNCAALTSFEFSTVTSMEAMALQGSGITKIKFGNKDLDLANGSAFSDAEKLVSICYPGTKAQWEAIVKNGNVLNLDKVSVHYVESSKIVGMTGQDAQYCKAGEHFYVETEDPTPETEPDTDNPDSEHKHSWSAWKTKTPATVFKAEVQMRTCSKCGKTETRTVGKKLTPTITVNAKKVWLKKGQKTSAFKVSGLANGDSVKSYKSSNKKIFTVTNKGVIKAGKKVGKAKLTITLASGKKKVVTVQVLNRRVKTRNITNLPAKVTLKKGATYKLSPVVIQITSTHKLTYKSSNKKVATVTSAGKIKGIKKGTATIKVKSGKVTKKVKVTVK